MFPKPRKGKTLKNWANDALGFKVSVRRKGKFAELKTRPLTKQSALSLGYLAVEKSLARSFRISPTAGRGISLGLPQARLERLRGPRGKSRLPGGTYIEKIQFGLNTAEERLGIKTARRAAPRKAKKKRRKRK